MGSFPTPDFHLPERHPEIAFLGRSNVGKSSLINAVLGRRALARTSRIPGKTRACNVFNVDNRFYLVDLPGYGYARASETDRRAFRSLLTKYLAQRTPLAGVVWLLDIRRDPSDDDVRFAARLAADRRPVIAAITKADKIVRSKRSDRVNAILETLGLGADQCIVTSAKSREGIGALRDAIDDLVAA